MYHWNVKCSLALTNKFSPKPEKSEIEKIYLHSQKKANLLEQKQKGGKDTLTIRRVEREKNRSKRNLLGLDAKSRVPNCIFLQLCWNISENTKYLSAKLKKGPTLVIVIMIYSNSNYRTWCTLLVRVDLS